MNSVERLSQLDDNSRFSRFRLISWWDQELLSQTKALVLGAGALGNEIVKNLALLGVGRVLVADLDTVDTSNLSRSVLFRPDDIGRWKAEVAATRARDIYPAMRIHAFCGNVVYDLGLGAYRWADVILAGLDNREARVAINQAAARTGKPWIDGAIERLDGVARVFDPLRGPCYECTMNEVDWKMLQARRSCALLSREEMQGGKVPTTPTTASVIAGIQCQEAVKLVHGLETLSGKGFVFDGASHQSYVVSYTQNPDCLSHEAFAPVKTLPFSSSTISLGALLDVVQSDVGKDAVIELNVDVLESLCCPVCGEEEPILKSLSSVKERQARCPKCGTTRVPRMFHTIDSRCEFLDRTLSEIGIPAWEILGARSGMNQCHYEIIGDQGAVLGPLDCSDDFRGKGAEA